MAQVAYWLLVGAASVYGLAIVTLTALWMTDADQTWWTALTNIFALYMFAPLLVLVPLALAVPSWWLRGIAGASLAIFLASFGAQLLPPAPRQASGTPLRVVTFNHLYSNDRIDEIVATIRAQDADIVALQELSRPVAEAARAQLGDMYPYQHFTRNEWGHRLGLLSRHPFEVAPALPALPRQRFTVNVGGRHLTLINVHLTSPDAQTYTPPALYRLTLPAGYSSYWRDREAPLLLDEIDATSGPLVVVGDFNTGDREPLYREFDQRLHDAYGDTVWGLGFTYPLNRAYFGVRLPFPVVRIDYVWSRDGVVPTAARTICQGTGSDHCMLVADLRLNAER
ncbi:MAG: hypothetical protein RLZZ387_760 [Chloroflexota bacterium]|jgi:endonuclease/exonuclease/phosphatase (EEP) superfamily protein YafD